MIATKGSWLVRVAIGLWSVSLLTGLHFVWQYASTPGAATTPPDHWPEASGLSRAHDRPTLVMAAHPYCSCTGASLDELAVLMSELGDRARAFVVFNMPGGGAERWEQTESWRRAATVPGVTVVADRDGAAAAAFRSTTSGHVVAYAPDGALLYSGGITASRGHRGQSPGRRRLMALLEGTTPDRRDSPVFGCALDDPSPALYPEE